MVKKLSAGYFFFFDSGVKGETTTVAATGGWIDFVSFVCTMVSRLLTVQ
jgi:hypothetical protein